MISSTLPVFATTTDKPETESPAPDSDDQNSDPDTTDSESDETAIPQFDSIADAALLMEASTGEVLYEKASNEALPPASITKVMTLLLTFEALERGDISLDDEVYISEEAWLVEGSEMFLLVDTKVPLSEIITGISVVSANDGCIAVAEHISGSQDAFVQLMNKRAQELGMTNTSFQNPHGLPADGHRMSAKDIATLARELIVNHPKILEIESMTELKYNDILQYNRNPLLGVYPGADGLKTGWTEEAGYCLVGTAERNDMRLISVVLKTKDEKERLNASRELLDYGYQNYEIKEVISKGASMGDMDVKNGKELSVPLKTDNSVSLVIHKDKISDIQTQLILDEEIITAPVTKDSKVGRLDVKLDDKVLASTEVSTVEEVEKAGFFEILWRGIANFFKSLFNASTEE
ncbi:MAG: D-alanyl-D-alanine carboxypeptidase [Clostridiales bacterium]|nr:D-alanyl-D-alanine carboxypeptidase [Clostridiales bacterium]